MIIVPLSDARCVYSDNFLFSRDTRQCIPCHDESERAGPYAV